METLIQSQSIPILPIIFSIFLVIYLVAYFIVFRSWTPKTRPEASSCFISLFHGTPAVFLATYAILSDPHIDFGSINTGFQSSVLDYSIAYFLVDLGHYLMFYPSDVLFIGHHLATLFVFVTCRYVVLHGSFSVLVLLILAEVTSLCQNAWTLAGVRKSDSETAKKVYGIMSPPFYAFYSVVRGFFGPWFVYRMGVFYASVDHVIPRWVWVSWVVVVVGALCVSILWIVNLWVELHRMRIRISEKKIK